MAPALTAKMVILAGIYLYYSVSASCSHWEWVGTYSGASLAWKLSGPMMLAMLKAAATRELPAT